MSQQFTSSMHSAMEQAKYWMWTRRKFPVRPSFLPSTIPPTVYYGESWEEKAFAEDSAGLLGGCVWPPRSYSCSFCGREFRSAQALGGHMNVHRRDRARLKQSSLAPDDVDHDDRHRIDSSTIPNPNPNFGIDASLPPSRKLIDDLNFSATHSLWGVELKLGSKRRMEVEEEDDDDDDDDDDDKIQNSCKRKKIDSFLFVEGKLNLSPGAVEDLDLELRLGDLPKVK